MRQTLENSRSIPHECAWLSHLDQADVIFGNEPQEELVIEEESEDQMSAESSKIEDSKDGRDGLGHRVTIVRLFRTPVPFPNPFASQMLLSTT